MEIINQKLKGCSVLEYRITRIKDDYKGKNGIYYSFNVMADDGYQFELLLNADYCESKPCANDIAICTIKQFKYKPYVNCIAFRKGDDNPYDND